MPGGNAALRHCAVSAALSFSLAPISFETRARGSTDGTFWRKTSFRDDYAGRHCGVTPARGFGGPYLWFCSHFVCGPGEVKYGRYVLAGDPL